MDLAQDHPHGLKTDSSIRSRIEEPSSTLSSRSGMSKKSYRYDNPPPHSRSLKAITDSSLRPRESEMNNQYWLPYPTVPKWIDSGLVTIHRLLVPTQRQLRTTVLNRIIFVVQCLFPFIHRRVRLIFVLWSLIFCFQPFPFTSPLYRPTMPFLSLISLSSREQKISLQRLIFDLYSLIIDLISSQIKQEITITFYLFGSTPKGD